MKRILIHGDQKANMKVWESPFIPSHLTFKSFEFHSINQTISQIYLFIITFQNLEFWDVTYSFLVISFGKHDVGRKDLGTYIVTSQNSKFWNVIINR